MKRTSKEYWIAQKQKTAQREFKRQWEKLKIFLKCGKCNSLIYQNNNLDTLTILIDCTQGCPRKIKYSNCVTLTP